MFDEHGRTIYRGQEALDKFAEALGSRLSEARKLHYKTSFQNLPISIENRKGSVRRGVGDDGEEWETKMKHPYGYIRGTEGPDGDAVDVFVGPNEDAAYAYVIHSNNPETGEFDEDKVMLGFNSSKRAKEVFMQHYDDPKFFGGIDAIPMWQFSEKVFVKKHTLKKLVASMRESSRSIPKGIGATGLDQSMKRAMLGNHQPQMINPEVREAREPAFASLQVPEDMLEHGTKGMHWGQRSPREVIEHVVGKENYKGAMEHPKKGTIHLFDDTATGSTMAMYEDKIRDPQSVRDHIADSRAKFAHESRSREGGPGSGPHLRGQGGSKRDPDFKNTDAMKDVLKDFGKQNLTAQDELRKDFEHFLSRRPKKKESRRSFESRLGSFMRESRRSPGTYYARELARYDTDAEEADLDLIRESFGGRVDFPQTKRHGQLGMGYFHEKIDRAKRVVIKPTRGKRLTAGVFSEAKHAIKKGIPVYGIHKGRLRRVKNVEALGNPNKSGHFGRVIYRKRRQK